MSEVTVTEPEKKIPYEKPVLRRITLVAEEVLAVGCKTASTNPGGVMLGGPACVANPCAGTGS